MPVVSIITATYNRGSMLRRSIRNALKQTFPDFELLVVDDCSTDNTAEVVSEFKDDRIEYIRLEKNSGGCLVPRTVGLKTAKGKYIAILDDDDFWVDYRKLEMQVSYLDKNPGYVLVGTDAVATNGDNKIAVRFHYPRSDNAIRDRMLMQNCFFHSSVMYRTETVMAVGGYIMQKKGFYANYANDYDLWCRVGQLGKLANLPIYGVGFTFPPTPLMSTRRRLALLKLYLEVTGNYRNYYPNYEVGILSHTVATAFELPLIAPLKKYFRRFASQNGVK